MLNMIATKVEGSTYFWLVSFNREPTESGSMLLKAAASQGTPVIETSSSWVEITFSRLIKIISISFSLRFLNIFFVVHTIYATVRHQADFQHTVLNIYRRIAQHKNIASYIRKFWWIKLKESKFQNWFNQCPNITTLFWVEKEKRKNKRVRYILQYKYT